MKNVITMNSMITALALIGFSSVSLATDCVSMDLSREKQSLASNAGLSTAEKSVLFEMAQNTKVVQLLTCAGLNESISTQDADFAIVRIRQDRDARIFAINQEIQRMKALLQDPTISEPERSIYIQALKTAPGRISYQQNLADSVIGAIQRASK